MERFSANSGNKAADFRFLYLSPAARYALLGMRVLALGEGAEGFRLVQDFARRAGLRGNSLAKVFQRLASRGLLHSRRGPGGGYSLARPSREISLADILRAVQDIVPGGHHCLLGNKKCAEGELCVVHRVIIEADLVAIEGFRAVTLEQFARSGGWS